MNAFQTTAVERIASLLKTEGITLGQLSEEGEAERFLKKDLNLFGHKLTLNVFVDELGVLVDDTEWFICEVPDYDSQSALIAAYLDRLSRLIARFKAQPR